MIKLRHAYAFTALFSLALLCGCNKSEAASTTVGTASPTTANGAGTTTTTNADTGNAGASGGTGADVLSPDEANAQFKANKSSLMGKRIKIKGYYFSYTEEGDKLNAALTQTTDISSKGPLCVFPSSAKPTL